MTADENLTAIAGVCGGQVIVEAAMPLSVGQIIQSSGGSGLSGIPLRVIGPATLAEFTHQCDLAATVAPGKRYARAPGMLYYKTEAAD